MLFAHTCCVLTRGAFQSFLPAVSVSFAEISPAASSLRHSRIEACKKGHEGSAIAGGAGSSGRRGSGGGREGARGSNQGKGAGARLCPAPASLRPKMTAMITILYQWLPYSLIPCSMPTIFSYPIFDYADIMMNRLIDYASMNRLTVNTMIRHTPAAD
jgi:hypothetical protein